MVNDTSDAEHLVNHSRKLNSFDSILTNDSETMISLRPTNDSRSDKTAKVRVRVVWKIE